MRVTKSRTRELAPPTFEDIVAKADLIVQGRVAPAKTYLSDDKMHLYTDYVVTAARVLLQRTGLSVQRPGMQTDVVIKQFGGTMVLEGVQISEQDDNMPPLPVGADLLLILQYNKAESKYELPGEVAGAFSVAAGRIAPLIRASRTYERFHGMGTAQFDSEVRRLRP